MEPIHLPQLLSIILFLFGGVMFLWAGISLLRSRQSLTWPVTQGEILQSKVTRYTHGRWWDCHVQYQYTVNDHEFNSSRVYFGTTPRISVARAIVVKFPANTKADVYYSPNNPGISVLIRGPNRYTYSAFLIGPCLWGMALVFWYIK